MPILCTQCHASRYDILLGFLMEAQQRAAVVASSGSPVPTDHRNPYEYQSALIVTGCDEAPLSTQTLEIITATQAPLHHGAGDNSKNHLDFLQDVVMAPTPRMQSTSLNSAAALPPTPSILLVPNPTKDFLEKLHRFTPKFTNDDLHRISATIEHYERYIDFDLLLERTRGSVSTGFEAATVWPTPAVTPN
jgi:hypothetical protein